MKKDILILCSGGVRGFAHLGVLYYLEKIGILGDFVELCGVSVGAMILGLYLIGYSPYELFDFILDYDVSKLQKYNIENIDKYGFDSGEEMEKILNQLVIKKGKSPDITLLELYQKTNKKFVVYASCVNTASMVELSHITHPNLTLIKALRMSSCIPILFCPIFYDDKYYIDGACIDNFPIKKYDDRLNRVLGILFSETRREDNSIKNLEDYVKKLFAFIIDNYYCATKAKYLQHVVHIDVTDVNMMDFSILCETKIKLFVSGYKSMLYNYKKLFC